jgi:hypothetical protein
LITHEDSPLEDTAPAVEAANPEAASPEAPAPEAPEAPESPAAAPARERRGPTPVNIRNFSVRCGRCDQYQVIVGFKPLDEEWNLYTYECDSEPCVSDPSLTRTLIEVPIDLDEFANRDPNWRGGKKWGGA